MCITIGPALLLLSFMEKIKNGFTNTMVVFGRTAFFYYILHLYLIHLLAAILFFVKRKHTVQFAIDSTKDLPFMFVIPGEGIRLGLVYLVWIIVIVALYPLCKWYDNYKINHKEKWWLSYL